jgi:hypothetical protein
VSRRLGKLAVARYKQAGQFRVRQREQLRRALHTAGESLEWDVLTLDETAGTDEVIADIRRLTQAGLRQLERDLEAEIAEKRAEVKQLEKTVNVLSELAEADDEAFPQEIEYHFTAKRNKTELVTRTEELVVEDPSEAEKKAGKIEKRLGRFGRLRDEMIIHLKKRQKTLAEAKSELRSFVRGTGGVVDEVLMTLT